MFILNEMESDEVYVNLLSFYMEFKFDTSLLM